MDGERARDRGRGARVPRGGRAARRAVHRLRVRRRARSILGRGHSEPARGLRPQQARRRGSGAAARAGLRGGAGRGGVQRTARGEAHVRGRGGGAAPFRQGGARLPGPGGLADAGRQRGGDGHRALPQRRARPLALRGRLDRLARRVLPGARAQVGRGRAAGGAGADVRGEARGRASRPLRAEGRPHPASARRLGAAGAGRGAGSVHRRAGRLMEAAQQTRPAGAEAAVAGPLPQLARRPSRLAEVWRFRQLIALLVVRELKVRYKRSVLGVLWTMLNPLLLMVVYAVVFTTILPAAMPNFSIFLLAGLLPWLYFSTSLMQGLMSVLVNQELIRKVRLPQAVFPLSVVGSNLVNFTLSLVPLFVVMLALHQPFTAALLILPI